MNIVDFMIPERIEDARRALLELNGNGIAAAGCTAFHFYADGPAKTAVLLTHLDLAGIRQTPGAFRIGALTPLTALHRHRADGWVLDRVVSQIASHQIRAVSTIGGNIARVFPWADLPVALLALDGQVIVQGEDPRAYAMDHYFKTQPATLFTPGDLLTHIEVAPLNKATGFGHIKQRMKSESFSMATASVRLTLEGDTLACCRIALGACIPFPTRLTVLENRLAGVMPADRRTVGKAIAESLDSLSFLSKEGMTKDYIRHLAATTLADAIEQAAHDAQGRRS